MWSDAREYYMLPINDSTSIENIRRSLSPIKSFENIFSRDELDDIWYRIFKHSNAKVRYHTNGNIIISDYQMFQDIYRDYKEKIDFCVGNDAELSPTIGGNFFITPQQYGLHNDSIRPKDIEVTYKSSPLNSKNRKYTCWKNILIPLWIGDEKERDDGGQFVAFEQRDIDYAKIYNGGNSTPNIGTVYEIVTDYGGIQFYDGNGNKIPLEKNKISFDKEHFKYCNTPYDRLKGLTVESIINWKPGNPFVFDAVQLHLSNSGSVKGTKSFNNKSGLLLTFLKELDADLLEQWRERQKTL